MRQLIRRLRTCEAGSGLVEYALLIAVVALGLVGVLRFFRNTTGGLTNRVSVSVSTQTGGGYGGGTGGAPYHVTATISWFSAGRTQSETVETCIAPRLGDEPNPDRRPEQNVDRMQ